MILITYSWASIYWFVLLIELFPWCFLSSLLNPSFILHCSFIQFWSCVLPVHFALTWLHIAPWTCELRQNTLVYLLAFMVVYVCTWLSCCKESPSRNKVFSFWFVAFTVTIYQCLCWTHRSALGFLFVSLFVFGLLCFCNRRMAWFTCTLCCFDCKLLIYTNSLWRAISRHLT